MRLKTTTDACKDALLRSGFEPMNNIWQLRLDGDKPGEVYEAWFPPDGYRWDCFVEITKGTVVGSKTSSFAGWDWTNTIKLRLV